MAFYPCQQADGDADDEQVTDRSGNGAHATIGSLTSAEAWANAGYFSSLKEVGHFGEMPLANYTHRYSTDTLLVFGQAYAEKDGVGLVFLWGNGFSDTITGGSLGLTANGALQFALRGAGVANATSSPVPSNTFATASLHSYMLCVDTVARSVTIGVDGAILLSGNTTIASDRWELADASVTRGLGIGNRAGATSTSNQFANQQRLLHFLSLRGKPAPTNLVALTQRMHAHPRMMLRDSDLQF
jgi:hypothetical protein